MSRRRRRTAAGAAVVAVLAGVTAMPGATMAPAAEDQAPAGAETHSETGHGVPGTLTREDNLRPGPAVSRAEMERRQRYAMEQREAVAARTGPGGAAEAAGSRDRTPELQLPPENDVSDVNFVRRNNRNTRSSQVSSLLAEPAAANDGTEVLYMGNTYFSRSADNGVTWTADPTPAGPAGFPAVCCDPDVVHKGDVDTTYAVMLYRSSALTDGVVRLFVRRDTIGGGNDCAYTFNPAGTTVVPDYPHIAVSKNFVYLSINRIDTKGTSSTTDDTWVGSSMIRFNAFDLRNCLAGSSVRSNTFNYTNAAFGQKVFVPVENIYDTTTMYWGATDTSTQFRIFRWPESTTVVSQFTRSLPHASNFTNPDCRGGTGNFDYLERGTSFSAQGFRLRGARVPLPGGRLWFTWNVNRDSSHAQAHVHSAIFRESDLALIGTPHVHNASQCVAFPAIGGNNTSGFFGLTVAIGGKFGGGGPAAQGYVAVDDNDSAGNFFPTASLTASGTHNPSGARFGDYFTIRRSDRCSRAWVATNYALLNGNTSSSHVNARYVEFGSNADSACF